jgi:hypothetical protein
MCLFGLCVHGSVRRRWHRSKHQRVRAGAPLRRPRPFLSELPHKIYDSLNRIDGNHHHTELFCRALFLDHLTIYYYLQP